MKFIAIIIRTLKPGKTYEDFRKAWFHTIGFGSPTTMYTVVDAFNPRDIISIGIVDAKMDELSQALDIDIDQRLAKPLDDLIESTIVRKFGLVTAIDDFSATGNLDYCQPAVDGEQIDFASIPSMLTDIAAELRQASKKRDTLKNQKPE